MLDVAGFQILRRRYRIENRLGGLLVCKQVHVMPGNLITLRLHDLLHITHPLHRAQLGLQNDAVVGLRQKVITPSIYTSRKIGRFG